MGERNRFFLFFARLSRSLSKGFLILKNNFRLWLARPVKSPCCGRPTARQRDTQKNNLRGDWKRLPLMWNVWQNRGCQVCTGTQKLTVHIENIMRSKFTRICVAARRIFQNLRVNNNNGRFFIYQQQIFFVREKKLPHHIYIRQHISPSLSMSMKIITSSLPKFYLPYKHQINSHCCFIKYNNKVYKIILTHFESRFFFYRQLFSSI